MSFFCSIKATPENGTWLTYDCTTPNWYFDFKDVPFNTHLDVFCTNNGSVLINHKVFNPQTEIETNDTTVKAA